MKISIITVVKNDKENLLISLRSVISQNYKNFEYIIYDGMSNDGTKLSIKKYLNKNIKYIYKKDKNYYDGLNKAIKIAKGEYVGILNAGDRYANSGILKKIIDKISLTKCDLVFGKLNYVKNNRVNRVWNYPIVKLDRFSALKIASPTMFLKRKILLSNPYDIKYNISSDTNLNLKISQQNHRFVYIDKILVLMQTGGLSTNKKLFLNKMKQDFEILYKYFGVTTPLVYIYKISLKISSFRFFSKKI